MSCILSYLNKLVSESKKLNPCGIICNFLGKTIHVYRSNLLHILISLGGVRFQTLLDAINLSFERGNTLVVNITSKDRVVNLSLGTHS